MAESFVYALFDISEPDHWRYVGVSKHPDRRLKDHLKHALKTADRHPKDDWIRKVYRNGSEVLYTVIEVCSSQEDAYSVEPSWIEILRNHGHRLTNVAVGGEGSRGNSWNDPNRQLTKKHEMIEFYRVIDPNDPNDLGVLRRANIGALTKQALSTLSDEARERVNLNISKTHNSEEYRAKMRHVWDSPAYRQLNSERTKLQTATPEFKDAMSKRMQEQWSDESWKEYMLQRMVDTGVRKAAADKTAELWKDPNHRADRILRMTLGQRRFKAKKNGWVLELIS